MEKHLNSNLEARLHNADSNPYLNYNALIEACNKIFQNRKAIPYEEFQKLTEESYQIDMEEYARLHNFTDAVKLTEYFSYVRTKIEQSISRRARTDRILVIGCGQGRLAEVYVALAKKLGIKEISFNDLIDAHIEQTRCRIKDLFAGDGLVADGVKISYFSGDFATIEIPYSFDMAFSFWYVGSEFLDPSSAENIQRFRHQLYSKINNILIPGGGLLEDIPDPNMEPGFYQIGNNKTAHILEQRKILLGQHKNLLLSNWTREQSTGFPYQLRYTARNGSDVREKEAAGFVLKKTESLPIPIQSMYKDSRVVLSSLEDIQNIWEVIQVLHQLILQTVKLPLGDVSDQKRRKITWWQKAH